MKVCLVTGGAGFVGSWLCESLLSKGHRVICIDNLVTGSEKNIEHLRDKEGFVFVNSDVSKSLSIEENVDYVFHLASPASPIDYQKIPIKTMMANSLGTLNSLEIAKNKGARFLLASTSEVYGDPLEHPQKEGYWGNVNPIGPRSCYDESKRFAEALTMSYRKEHEMDVRIARIFNTYGPRMRKNDGRVMPNFINQALKGESITVYGNGKQTRSFCYVTDLVDGLERLMFKEGISGTVLNLGNPDEYSILEIAEKVKSVLNSKSEVTFRELPVDDPMKRRPDITRVKENLQWEPKMVLDQGLAITIKWFMNNNG